MFLKYFQLFSVTPAVPQNRKNERLSQSQSSQANLITVKNPEIRVNSSSFDDIYKDTKNPASYSSNVRAFMNQKRSISIHKRRIKNFTRRQIIVPGPFHSISADLIDYQSYSRINSGYNYILNVIDMFSRMAFARPLKTKTALEVSEALDEIISSMQFVPKFFTSDKGREFDIRNKYFHGVIVEKYHMVVYFTSGSKKNSMVERLNRTLKERLERFFSETGRKRWIDALPDFISNINHSINRSIGIRPVDVTLENAPKIWKKLYPKANSKPKCDKILVGDRVRIAIDKQIFSKGYHQNWTDELFTVKRIEPSMGICLYILENNDKIEMQRKFYIFELNFVSRTE